MKSKMDVPIYLILFVLFIVLLVMGTKKERKAEKEMGRVSGVAKQEFVNRQKMVVEVVNTCDKEDYKMPFVVFCATDSGVKDVGQLQPEGGKTEVIFRRGEFNQSHGVVVIWAQGVDDGDRIVCRFPRNRVLGFKFDELPREWKIGEPDLLQIPIPEIAH